MENILIKLKDKKALSLLVELEKFNIIELIKEKKKTPKKNLLDLLDSMSIEAGESLEKHIIECRNSWERTL